MQKKMGKQTICFENDIYITGHASIIAGKKEGESKYSSYFDMLIEDDMLGEDSFERAEKLMFKTVTANAINYCKLKPEEIEVMLGGDLLNQIISAGFTAGDFGIPFFGLYGACSTMAESTLLGAALIDGGFYKNAVCTTSSHFATAERQFRMPLEMGTPRTTTSQQTVTGAGSCVLSTQDISGEQITVKCGTVGVVLDMGITDANNMGAAMAPACAQTILTHLDDMKRAPEYYDKIVTGDLGTYGSEMLIDIFAKAGTDLGGRHMDCGSMIFEGLKDVQCGASGCGCAASMFNGYFIKSMLKGIYKRLLFVPTGALQSKTSTLQGENIPAIAYAIEIERMV